MKQGKRFASAILICAGALSTASTTANDKTPGVQSAQEVWHQWQRAASRGDVAFFEKLLTPNYVGVSWHEKTQDRAAALAAIGKQPKNVAAATPSTDELVQIYGNHASVHALITDRVNDRPQRILATANFVFRDGRWRAFYSQQTLVDDGIADTAVLPKADAQTASSAESQDCVSPERGFDIGAHLISLRHQWLISELHGDTQFLDCLLAPDYRDANYRGSSRNRDALLEYSKKHADPNKPIPPSVPQMALVEGDSAVVRNLWSGPMNGKEVKVWLADTFVRKDGRWRAIFSQQTLVRE